MSASRPLFLVATVALITIVVAIFAAGLPRTNLRSDDVFLGRSGGAGNPEAGEQGEQAAERAEAFQEAVEQGKAGKPLQITSAPAAGWAGEKLVDATADDWEPALAADPNGAFVYMLETRYATTKPCPGNCPTPYMALERSTDNGATWSSAVPLCACKGSGQFDPIIEVVNGPGSAAGNVYAAYMNGFNIVFLKSIDHGLSWSSPVKVYGNVSWNDKPTMAVSNDGRDVYIPFNGPTGGDPWLAQSHDFGATWTQKKLVDSNRYYFTFDSDVANDGTVYLAESSLLYGGGGNKGTTPTGTVDEHVFVSTDRGSTFIDRPVASVQPGIACTAAGCTPDYYLGHDALSVDASGRVVFLYDGAASAGGLQTVAAKTSTDRGTNWSNAFQLSATGAQATDPAVEAGAAGDLRAWYMQTTGSNVDQWNVYYRSSTDGGVSWGAAVKLSDATSGAAYKSTTGFLEPYGDYGEIAITSANKTIAVWGEGNSYSGPGGVWFNRMP